MPDNTDLMVLEIDPMYRNIEPNIRQAMQLAGQVITRRTVEIRFVFFGIEVRVRKDSVPEQIKQDFNHALHMSEAGPIGP